MDQLLEAYGRASAWTTERVEGAVGKLDASTPCEEWDVRTLLNHMLETQRYFLGSARGEEVSPPSAKPSDLLSSDPVTDFAQARVDTLDAFGQPGVIDKTGPSLGIALSDQLLHGWDLAQATAQDATMPPDLAETAFAMIHGKFTDEQRTGVFKAAQDVSPSASAQDKLLAYTGRTPSS